MKEMTCGWKIECFSLLYDYYAIIDTESYLADNLFIKHRVTVDFQDELSNPDTEYIVIFCRCRKRDSRRFQDALEELPDKMLICGHTDYIDFCREIYEKVRTEKQKTYRKEENTDETGNAAEQAEQEGAERVS